MVAFHALLTEDGNRFAGMQFHPDAESMVFHMQVVKEAVEDISGSLEIEEFKVMGPSNDAVDSMMKGMAASGVKVEHLPDHVAGFPIRRSRLAAKPSPDSLDHPAPITMKPLLRDRWI